MPRAVSLLLSKTWGAAKEGSERMSELQNILVVEDEEADRFFIQRAFDLVSASCSLYTVANGQEAIDYIAGFESYADRAAHPFPDVVITDWRMPIAGGVELLEWMREHPYFMVMPVIVLSASDEREDVKNAYCAGITAYLIKPQTQEALAEILQDFIQFWRHVENPRPDIGSPCNT